VTRSKIDCYTKIKRYDTVRFNKTHTKQILLNQMHRNLKMRWIVVVGCAIVFLSICCKKPAGTVGPPFPVVTEPPAIVGSILNTSHLEKLAVAVTFPNEANYGTNLPILELGST
jgi:hypothetical protein